MKIEYCEECPDLVKLRRRIVSGDGSVPADVMIIGQNPARDGGDLTGIPFTSPKSGALVRRSLRKYTDEFSIYVTNAIKCFCPQPKAVHWVHCSKFLRAEIAEVKPKVIITLGKIASFYFSKTFRRITPCGGPYIKRYRTLSRTLIPIFHPSYYLRKHQPHLFTRAFEKALELAKEEINYGQTKAARP